MIIINPKLIDGVEHCKLFIPSNCPAINFTHKFWIYFCLQSNNTSTVKLSIPFLINVRNLIGTIRFKKKAILGSVSCICECIRFFLELKFRFLIAVDLNMLQNVQIKIYWFFYFEGNFKHNTLMYFEREHLDWSVHEQVDGC